MDIKRLQSFLRIAELGSLSRVSDRLRIAQPALSRQLRLLEDEVGLQLFERHRRGVNLTPAGEELRKQITGPLRQLEQAFEDVRALSDKAGGQLAFGVPPTVSYVLASRLARRVAESAPNVSLRIVEGYAGHLIDWLHRGEIDAAILYGPAADFHMKCEELLIEELVLVGPASSNLDPEQPVRFDAFAAMPLVLPSHPHGLRVAVENAAIKAKQRLTVKFEADSFGVLKSLVEAGLGYSALPRSALMREIEDGRLRFAPLTAPRVTRQLILGLRVTAQQTRGSKIISRLVREEISNLVREGAWDAFLQFSLPTPADGRAA